MLRKKAVVNWKTCDRGRPQELEAATEGSRRKLSERRTRIGGTADEARQQLQARSEELRKKYEELSGQGGAVSRRLMKAFPRMESRQYKETFNELREKLRLKEKMKRKKVVVQGSAPYPTRTTVGVTGLCGDALMEIELIAKK